MTDFLRALVEIVAYLWPLEKVSEWEEGNRYLFGRFRRTVGPGIYRRIPFFEDIKKVPVVPAIVVTPRLDITLKDGSLLTFAASGTCQVNRPDLAVNNVDNYAETTQESLAATLADKLAKVELKRFEPEGRQRLLSDLLRWVNEETEPFGVTVSQVRFLMFVLKPKAIRLMGDAAGQASDSW